MSKAEREDPPRFTSEFYMPQLKSNRPVASDTLREAHPCRTSVSAVKALASSKEGPGTAILNADIPKAVPASTRRSVQSMRLWHWSCSAGQTIKSIGQQLPRILITMSQTDFIPPSALNRQQRWHIHSYTGILPADIEPLHPFTSMTRSYLASSCPLA